MAKLSRGFTIIELLIVIAILGVLFFVVLVNVPKQGNQSGNVQRKSDVNALLVAVDSYRNAHNGELPDGITSEPKKIASAQGTDMVNLCAALVPTFIPALPLDPLAGSVSPPNATCTDKGARYGTGYAIQKTSDQAVKITAPSAEGGEVIFASD